MRIGVSGFEESLIKSVDFFEISCFDALLKSKTFLKKVNTPSYQAVAFQLVANQFYYRLESPIPLIDRVNTLIELAESIRAESCILKLTPTFFVNSSLDDLSLFKNQWKLLSKLPLLIDLPSEFPKSLVLDPSFILDPAWHKPKVGCLHYRIHGWNEERWVRRYSQDSLRTLVKTCVRFKPQTLTFAHSQRHVQVLEFLELWGSKK